MSAEVRLVSDPIDAGALLDAFTRDARGEGAVVSFTGLARECAADGAAVTALVLETYREVTLASMRVIGEKACTRFGIARCMVVHRAGRIAPGEVIVFVAAAARHRRAAFHAADYLMDRLKTEAVFWKREEGPAGTRWIEPVDSDHVDAKRWHHGERSTDY